MSDDNSNQLSNQAQNTQLNKAPEGEKTTPVVDLIQVMQTVDTNSDDAKLNVTSISDNNGGRIELNEEGGSSSGSIIGNILGKDF